MRIEIKQRGNSTAVLISFSAHSERFESNYERNRFYTGLYGRAQRVRHGREVYNYRREGLLDEIPHIKVDNSVFIVALQEMERILMYLREWHNKIEYKSFPVLLEPDEMKELQHR
ncbi:MAG: hypothetical protein HY366_00695 [Candidatus Aenigmarchaeota archaeon]|nr:hypothetical protein [Candidatus Aenigmarchaeota archaeon]